MHVYDISPTNATWGDSTMLTYYVIKNPDGRYTAVCIIAIDWLVGQLPIRAGIGAKRQLLKCTMISDGIISYVSP